MEKKWFVEYNGKFIAEYRTKRGALNFVERKGLNDDRDNLLRLWHNGEFYEFFDVACYIEYNADIFRERYEKYIINEREEYYDTTIFTLCAPPEIYDEIDELKEEMIEIAK